MRVPAGPWSRLRAWVVLDAFERDRHTVHIVGGERFDPYRVVREARRAGHRPGQVLATSRVARAFTAAQLATLVHDRLEPELHGAHALTVADPLDLLLTDEVRGAEAAVLLADMLDLLCAVAGTVPVLVTQRSVEGTRAGRALGRALATATRAARAAVDGLWLPEGPVWWGTGRQATLDAYRAAVEA